MKIKRQVVKVREGNKAICSFNYPLHEFTESVQPGGFSIPFVFRLPQHLAGSFKYEKGEISALISYRLSAKLLNSQGENLKDSAIIMVKQPGYSFHESVGNHTEAAMSTWCCIGKGVCRIHVSHSQNFYTPMDRVEFTTNIDNSAPKLNVLGLNAKVFFILRLRDNKNRTKFIKTAVLTDKLMRKIPSQCSLLASSGTDMALDLSPVKAELENRYSTMGKIIECIYNIDVEAIMEGSFMCCDDSPSVSALMTIWPDSNIYRPPPPTPADWAPKEIEQKVVEYQEWAPLA